MKKKCKECGAVFYTNRAQTLYCSKECKGRASNKLKKERKERSQAKRNLSLAEINRQARAAGMSYGKYVAEMYKERLKNEYTL